MNNTAFPKITKAQIFLAAAGALVIFNLYTLTRDTFKTIQFRHRFPYTFLGDRFRGIEIIVGKAPYVGYYTDKSLDNNHAAMQFAQAQLALAPSILDLNNTGHEFIIFDCTSPLVAMKKIQEIGAKPVVGNRYGIILAHRADRSALINGADIKTFDKVKQKQRP